MRRNGLFRQIAATLHRPFKHGMRRAMSTHIPPKSLLESLFDAERTASRVREELASLSSPLLFETLQMALREADAIKEHKERGLRLEQIAHLLERVEEEGGVDRLIDLLGDDEPSVRQAAGGALEEIGMDRFKDVASGVERALARFAKGHWALRELPYLLAQFDDPRVGKILAKFLQHSDPYAVASAIEAVVELEEHAAEPLLTQLEKDTRTVHIDDEEGEATAVTLGELAREGLALLHLDAE